MNRLTHSFCAQWWMAEIGRAGPGASFRGGPSVLETERTNSGTAFHGRSGGLRRVGDRSARERRVGRLFEAKRNKTVFGSSDFGEWTGEGLYWDPPYRSRIVSAGGD